MVNGKIPLYNGEAQDQLGPEERQAHPEELPPVLEDPQPSPDPQPPMFQNCVTVVCKVMPTQFENSNNWFWMQICWI